MTSLQFGMLQVPETLIEARDRGTLVIFAGAGVSCSPPSSLPDFSRLVDLIAEGAPLTMGKAEPLDAYLGRLEDTGVDVRARAKRFLTPPSSKPSFLHHLIVNLFSDRESVRIVTTNFDQHFSTALVRKYGDSTPSYYAPALPLGNNIRGLVYLHGSLDEMSSAVLTDRDFGKAYLTEGWARRFLLNLFRDEQVTVLFIGYSHTDPLLKYIARGFPSLAKSNRFSLTSSGEEEKWEGLGISPIEYSHGRRRRHTVLREALEKWSAHSNAGLLGQYQRVESLALTDPRLLGLEDSAFLKRSLRTPELTLALLGKARGHLWWEWARGESLVQEVLSGEARKSDHGVQLSRWIAEDLIPGSDQQVVDYLCERNVLPARPFLELLCRSLNEESAQERRAIWLPYLCNGDVLATIPTIVEELLLQLNSPGEASLAWRCLARLAEEEAGRESSLRLVASNPLQVENYSVWRPKARFAPEHLLAYWRRQREQLLPVIADQAIVGAFQQLAESHHHESDSLGGARDCDRFSILSELDDIEDRGSGSEAAGAFWIQVALDASYYLMRTAPKLAQAYSLVLWESRIPILKRIALLAIARDGSDDAGPRLNWISEQELLRETWLRPEVYRVIAASYRRANTAARISFLLSARQLLIPCGATDSQRYQYYNLLVWLSRILPDCQTVLDEMSEMVEAHPIFEPCSHPDRVVDRDIAYAGGENEYGVEYLLSLPPAALVRQLADDIERDHSGAFYRYHHLAKAVETNDRKLCEWINAAGAMPAVRALILELAATNWMRTMPTERVAEVLDLLMAFGLEMVNVHGVRIALGVMVQGLDANASPETLDKLEELGVLIAVNAGTESADGSADLLNTALRDPAGNAVWMLMCGINWRRRFKLGSDAFPESSRCRLRRVLAASTHSRESGEIVLAGYLQLLWHVDQEWCVENILPQFSWENPARATRAWAGLLKVGQPWRMEPRIVRELYSTALLRVGTDLREQSAILAEHVLWLSMSIIDSQNESDWLPRLFAHAPAEARTRFFVTLAHALRKFTDEDVSRAWDEWIYPLLNGLAEGMPRRISTEEVAAYLLCLPELGGRFKQAVEMIPRLGLPGNAHTMLWYRLHAKSNLIPRHPVVVIDLALHLRERLSLNDCRDLRIISEQLKESSVSDAAHTQFVEILVGIGCPGAASMLR